jgi:hypothetical protein
MATILGVSAANYQYGIEADETGINIASFSCRYFPEFDDKLPNKDGQTIIRARPEKFSREISLSGEVNGATISFFGSSSNRVTFFSGAFSNPVIGLELKPVAIIVMLNLSPSVESYP